MTILVQQNWEQVGVFTDGSPVRAVRVFDDRRIVGRVVDVGGGNFRADFVTSAGDLAEVIMPDYYAAILRIAEEAKARFKRLH